MDQLKRVLVKSYDQFVLTAQRPVAHEQYQNQAYTSFVTHLYVDCMAIAYQNEEKLRDLE